MDHRSNKVLFSPLGSKHQVKAAGKLLQDDSEVPTSHSPIPVVTWAGGGVSQKSALHSLVLRTGHNAS